MDEDNNAEFNRHKREFSEFLDPQHGESRYPDKIENLVRDQGRRLVVDLDDLNAFDEDMRRNFLQHPMDYLPAWEDSLRDYIAHLDDAAKEVMECKIGVEGSFGAHRLTPQSLRSEMIGRLVCVEGIVTKCSLVQPKVVRTVHYCEATQEYHTHVYRDATALNGLPTSSVYPTADDQGNPLQCEYGLSTFMDTQTVHIQDMPERTAAGSMPQNVECIIEDDLVDGCKPGDRVQMIGIYRALAGRSFGTTSGRFRTVILVNNIRRIGTDDNSRRISGDEIKKIRKLSKRKDLLPLLARSIAPSLYGHEHIKEAIVLQLLGGVEKNLDNGTHIRGDINILMVGDPSCGKSQLLRAVMNIAPLAINTTGRGSSGVGLTAAVTMDRQSGERRLEAGAMVLADRGIVCIDEFDKMSDADRTAIHEVMEQQTVTVAKAGIHTSLNARCSVIAAANPVYGQYDRSMKPHQNIALPDSLLSRFDLLFIVLDKIDTNIDRSISEHVMAMHLVPPRDELVDEFGDLSIDVDRDEDPPMFETNLPNIVRDHERGKRRRSKRKDYLTTAFCKKYIEFAKKQFAKPVLTDEACELIAQKYGELRDAERDQTLPITARCLETIIRLSSARAKLRLSKSISEDDVEDSMEILSFALTNDAKPQEDLPQRKKRKGKRAAGSDSEEESEDDDDDDGKEAEESPRKTRRRKRSQIVDSADDDDVKMEQLDEPAETPRRGRKRTQRATVSTPDMRSPAKKKARTAVTKATKQVVARAFAKLTRRTDKISISALHQEVGSAVLSRSDLQANIDVLVQENKMFVGTDGQLYKF